MNAFTGRKRIQEIALSLAGTDPRALPHRSPRDRGSRNRIYTGGAFSQSFMAWGRASLGRKGTKRYGVTQCMNCGNHAVTHLRNPFRTIAATRLGYPLWEH
jgi:hypothetical protein